MSKIAISMNEPHPEAANIYAGLQYLLQDNSLEIIQFADRMLEELSDFSLLRHFTRKREWTPCQYNPSIIWIVREQPKSITINHLRMTSGKGLGLNSQRIPPRALVYADCTFKLK